ncbi:MAG: hypothetical protein KAG37_01680 [Flavobacteriales bacterium]|nr:hypothetical protein [Flavobacteriales bacterium]
MDIQARKLHFIQEFLKVQSEDVISKLEKVLTKSDNSEFKPMSMEQFNAEIDESLEDFKAGRFSTSDELLEEIKGWK